MTRRRLQIGVVVLAVAAGSCSGGSERQDASKEPGVELGADPEGTPAAVAALCTAASTGETGALEASARHLAFGTPAELAAWLGELTRGAETTCPADLERAQVVADEMYGRIGMELETGQQPNTTRPVGGPTG